MKDDSDRALHVHWGTPYWSNPGKEVIIHAWMHNPPTKHQPAETHSSVCGRAYRGHGDGLLELYTPESLRKCKGCEKGLPARLSWAKKEPTTRC